MVEITSEVDLLAKLKNAPNNSVDAIIILSEALHSSTIGELAGYFDEGIRALKDGGLLFVHGTPQSLPEIGVYLDQPLTFKYWIAIRSEKKTITRGYPTIHAAILLFAKGKHKNHIKRIRFPHQKCQFCGNYLKDWGGKTHLMHPDGYAASDVWLDIPSENNYLGINESILKQLFKIVQYLFCKFHRYPL